MVTWDIQRDGRAWGDEAMSRYQMTPEKTEMVGGRLYGTEEERLTMLAVLNSGYEHQQTVVGSPRLGQHPHDPLARARVTLKSRLQSAVHLKAGACPGRLPDTLVENRE
jgi:hypothetical protein